MDEEEANAIPLQDIASFGSHKIEDELEDLSDIPASVPLVNENRIQPTGSSSQFFQRQFFYFPPETSHFLEQDQVHEILPTTPPVFVICGMGCCPCLTGEPCSDEKKQEYKKVPKTIVFMLSIAQVVMFIVALALHGFSSMGENWLIGPKCTALFELGANSTIYLRKEYEIWRLITAIFLHSGFIELFFNLFYQMRIGLFLEPRWGWAKFAFVYVVTGMAGGILAANFDDILVYTSASASFLGIMGTYLAQLHITSHKFEGWQKKMNFIVCICIVFIIFFLSVGPNYISMVNQFGALMMGFAMGYTIFGREFYRSKTLFLTKVLPILGIVYVVLYFLAFFFLFYSHDLIADITQPIDADTNITCDHRCFACYNLTCSSHC